MGFADNDPGAFSLDVSSSPTYIAASTLGSAGCKNWDYARQQTVEIFSTSSQSGEFLTELRLWMNKKPELREKCELS